MFFSWVGCSEFLRGNTRLRGFWAPWKIGGAVGFILRLLGSLGFRILVAIAWHEDALNTTLKQLSDVRGSMLHYEHASEVTGDGGITRVCALAVDLRRFPSSPGVDLLRVLGNYQ